MEIQSGLTVAVSSRYGGKWAVDIRLAFMSEPRDMAVPWNIQNFHAVCSVSGIYQWIDYAAIGLLIPNDYKI